MLEQEGYDLMGAAFEVYNVLGYGMVEEVYQQSLEIELRERSISFVSKGQIEVFYKNHRLNATFRPDLIVFGKIVTELKAVKELTSDHEAQLFNYMRVSRQPVGYLLNYGAADRLEWRRYILRDFQSSEFEHE